jgi:OOP family OmpA-OmpF porin
MNRLKLAYIATAIVLGLTLLATGCATKKYVRNSIDPLEARLGKVEENSDQNSHRITDVDQRAQTGITEAKTQADSADKNATAAGERAQSAQTLAQSSMTEAERVREELRNSDNFQTLKTETLLFGFNHSNLDEDAQKKLDEIASLVAGKKRFIIQVQGYTDRTGPTDYNLELSRRRADAVVRYLTLEQKVPLARVFRIGYGEDAPAASNDTREGREQNRRVEVRVLTVLEATSPTQQAQATPATQ